MWEMVEFHTINYVQNTDLSMFTKSVCFLLPIAQNTMSNFGTFVNSKTGEKVVQ